LYLAFLSVSLSTVYKPLQVRKEKKRRERRRPHSIPFLPSTKLLLYNPSNQFVGKLPIDAVQSWLSNTLGSSNNDGGSSAVQSISFSPGRRAAVPAPPPPPQPPPPPPPKKAVLEPPREKGEVVKAEEGGGAPGVEEGAKAEIPLPREARGWESVGSFGARIARREGEAAAVE
jgi:hypothetical protein